MTQRSHYLIENKKPFETVQELKNEFPSFEEFANSYEYDENVANSYEAEYQDRVFYGPKIGPGNEQSRETVKSVAKVGTKMAVTTVASGALVAATGGLGAVAIGGLVATEGYLLKKIGEERGNDTISTVGDLVFDTGVGTITGGVFGTATTSLASQGTKTIGNKAAQTIAKNGRQVTEGARLLISCGKTMAELANDLRVLEKSYDIYCGTYEVTSFAYHGKHKDLGYGYKSDCPVCQGKF